MKYSFKNRTFGEKRFPFASYYWVNLLGLQSTTVLVVLIFYRSVYVSFHMYQKYCAVKPCIKLCKKFENERSLIIRFYSFDFAAVFHVRYRMPLRFLCVICHKHQPKALGLRGSHLKLLRV